MLERPRLFAGILFVLGGATAIPMPTYAGTWSLGHERIPSPTPGAGSFGAAAALLDFDGDGDLELAVGDPTAQDEDGAHPIVRILFATAGGWEDRFSFDLASRNGFGRTLAVGDFDEDGRDDLLIGAPQLNSGGGGVYLARHSDPTTLVLAGIILNGGASGGSCGTSLAVGDFDDDGHLDFATGCPYASFDTFSEVGRVEVGLGGGDGDFDLGFLHQGSPDVVTDPETGDEFGFALAAGDFDDDGYDDLAIGVPGEDVLADDDGAVHLLYGSPSGLVATGVLLWQEALGVPGVAEDGDRFGAALAAGDFDAVASPESCNCDDLAIGVPDDAENVGGAVVVLGGTLDGLGTEVAQIFAVGDMPPVSRPSNTQRLGWTLAAGRLSGGLAADLVIGAEGASPFMSTVPGTACVLRGGASGLAATDGICFEGGAGELGTSDQDSQAFSQAIAIGPLDDRDAGEELVLGSPGRRELFVLKSALFADGFEIVSTNRWSFDSTD